MEKFTLRSISTRVGFHPRQGPHDPADASRRNQALPRSDDGPHPGFPRLSDPEDVAARIAESWDREFAAMGGLRRDFAACARTRLRHWASAMEGEGLPMTFEARFRSQVASKVSARLDAWMRPKPPV
ncbi:MAG: hypothetical protein JF616_19555 [Fibrobacteres bacterium]|nr:hypothetical protein [Fibrobacterota bacterium]